MGVHIHDVDTRDNRNYIFQLFTCNLIVMHLVFLFCITTPVKRRVRENKVTWACSNTRFH